MKIKKTNRKLSIKKSTIAALQNIELGNAKGGGNGFPTTDPTWNTIETGCPTLQPECVTLDVQLCW